MMVKVKYMFFNGVKIFLVRFLWVGRVIYRRINRFRLKNRTVSVIASNCNGACICHDLKLRFNSPFVNLWMEPQDFIKMLKSLKHYMTCEIRFIKIDKINYPVGQLDDVKLYFLHYKSEKEAREKWKERVSRINYDNLFILFSDRDGCSLADLHEFDQLPYNKKVVFVHKPVPSVKSAFYIRGFENENSVGMCMNYRSKYSIRKYYDDFDYVSWFNSISD